MQNLIQAMLSPDFYPHRPDRVDLMQTHISYIFIAGEYVYKIKKAVDLGFLDFTTLEKRRLYCRKEIELNQRLASNVYLEVVPIGLDENDNVSLGKGTHILEYAVKMRRLPENGMLKRLFAEGKADFSIMDAIASKLASFHREAATGGEIDEMGSLEIIMKNNDENFRQTIPFIGVTISQKKYDYIKNYVHNFLQEHGELFRKRIADHKIRDCHGDLHLEHICLLDNDLIIFDCIEFNERFRYEDIAAEAAFLAMDLDYNNYAGYADAFINAYIRQSGDSEVMTLLNFYKCYYAYVRGKVISFRLNDSGIKKDDMESAMKSAARYFDLAYSYASRIEKPTLIIMAGLMGTGKSALARSLAGRLGVDLIRSDELRKKMLNIEPASRRCDSFGMGVYSDDISRKTYERALDIASEKIKEGKSVIIDASFKKRRHRQDAYEAARKLDAGFHVLECTCPDEVVKNRLEKRKLDAFEASDGRWEIYEAQKADYEAISEFPERLHLSIDTTQDPESSQEMIIKALKGTGSA